LESVAVLLGKRLRRLRDRAGLTQSDLAKAVLTNKTAISEIELGRQVPKLDLVQRLEAALEADGVLMDFYGLLSLGVQESAVVADVEHEALAITDWESRSVPGLLQTSDYMRANMAPSVPAERLDAEVSIRLGRQGILAGLLNGWFILDESVLRREYGGKDVMRNQLIHLEQSAGLDNLHIQVMPFTSTRHPGGNGPLRVVEYRDKPGIWFTEGPRSGRMSDEREEVLQVMVTLNVIRAAALSVAESVEFIREIRERLYEQ